MARNEKRQSEKPTDEKKVKKERPKPPAKDSRPKSAEEQDPDFTHLVRVAGVVLDGTLDIRRAVTKIKGVGPQIATAVVRQSRFDAKTKLGTLNEADVAELEQTIENMQGGLPTWMLNRRNDPVTGENLHLLGPHIDITLREDLTRMKKIRSYKGVRHSLNLPVRGQRTRSSFRHGKTLGVSRKKK